jgi:hypothetical protein
MSDISRWNLYNNRFLMIVKNMLKIGENVKDNVIMLEK